jgi:hypothetical protein
MMQMKPMKYLGGLAVVLLLSACGGGSPITSNGSTPGTAPGETVPVTAGSVTLSIVRAGLPVSSLSFGGANVARATVRDARGAPVGGRLVTFSLVNSGIATLDPFTALTDVSTGVAEIAIASTSLTSRGAASLSATAEVEGVVVTGRIDFSVSATSVSLSAVNATSISLPSGGNTTLTVTALVGGEPSAGVPVNVLYTASCGRINGSIAAGPVGVSTAGSGVASVDYNAVAIDGSLCSGPVTVSASSAGAAPQSITLTVAAPTANAVTFVSALPSSIFIAGFGAAEQSVVRFRVLSSAGTALPNVAVNFSIESNPGGVRFGAPDANANTDANGEVRVAVFSGDRPGPVRVRAALASDVTIFSESLNLTVASGPPSQRFMSLSVETFNIEGWNIDGIATQLTARIADRQGNAVEDGTVVNFIAEGGQVASNCPTKRVGNISSCSVDFISQNPRPVGGRVSVLAYTEGTKDYIDLNSNNKYEASDTLIDIGDAYRDDDENGVFDGGEFLLPRGGLRLCTGFGAPFPSRLDTCDGLLSTTVRQQVVIMFSSSKPVLLDLIGNQTGVTFRLASRDNPSLPMPAGTLVAARAFDADTTDGAACAIAFGPGGSPLPNIPPGTDPLAHLSTQHNIGLRDCRPGDLVFIEVTAPSGLNSEVRVLIP